MTEKSTAAPVHMGLAVETELRWVLVCYSRDFAPELEPVVVVGFVDRLLGS
jgi:hypothetical protein